MRRLRLNKEGSKSKGRLKPFQTAFCIFGLWLKQQEYRICRRMSVVESMAFQTNLSVNFNNPGNPSKSLYNKRPSENPITAFRRPQSFQNFNQPYFNASSSFPCIPPKPPLLITKIWSPASAFSTISATKASKSCPTCSLPPKGARASATFQSTPPA